MELEQNACMTYQFRQIRTCGLGGGVFRGSQALQLRERSVDKIEQMSN